MCPVLPLAIICLVPSNYREIAGSFYKKIMYNNNCYHELVVNFDENNFVVGDFPVFIADS